MKLLLTEFSVLLDALHGLLASFGSLGLLCLLHFHPEPFLMHSKTCKVQTLYEWQEESIKDNH